MGSSSIQIVVTAKKLDKSLVLIYCPSAPNPPLFQFLCDTEAGHCRHFSFASDLILASRRWHRAPVRPKQKEGTFDDGAGWGWGTDGEFLCHHCRSALWRVSFPLEGCMFLGLLQYPLQRDLNLSLGEEGKRGRAHPLSSFLVRCPLALWVAAAFCSCYIYTL